MTTDPVAAEVLAVIVAVVDGAPCVLTLPDAARLPAGPLLPSHRSLQTAVRAWVEEQTGYSLGYLEQLYTFADRDRAGRGARTISVSYLGLVPSAGAGSGRWRSWYSLFPWEDRRNGEPDVAGHIVAALATWSAGPAGRARRQRCAITFGLDGRAWQPDLALQRYEVLYEAGLVPESPDAGASREPSAAREPSGAREPGAASSAHIAGDRMDGDHRRVLATGIARLRAKIQYRPVVFELMPPEFTLGQLQGCVEALAGQAVHTQNFRRLVAQQQLVEHTGGSADTGGRPARLYRFRREVLQERQVAGTKLPSPRAR